MVVLKLNSICSLLGCLYRRGQFVMLVLKTAYVILIFGFSLTAGRIFTYAQFANYFFKRPTNELRDLGSEVVFECANQYRYRICWSINGILADKVMYVEIASYPFQSRLRIANVSVESEGSYCCYICEELAGISYCGQLTVKQGPTINVAPASKTVNFNTAMAFVCKVASYPTPAITWILNGSSICDNMADARCTMESETQTVHRSVLKISNASEIDAGVYKCVANTQFGSAVSENAWVTIIGIELTTSAVSDVQTTTQTERVKATMSTTSSKEDTENIGFQTTAVSTMPAVRGRILTTSSSADYHGNETPNPNGAILLISVAGIILIAIIVVVALCYRKRRKKNRMECKRRKSNRSSPATASKNVSVLENMKYPLEKLEFIEELGEGVFGLVYKARAPGLENPNKTTTVAVKMLRTADRMSASKVESFTQEAKRISSFKHRNLIQLLGVCAEEKCQRHAPGTVSCLLFEYMDGGDLCAFLRAQGPNKEIFKGRSGDDDVTVDESDKLSICLQIACGMKYLSERNFIHRDLATRNCLISSKELTIKIADFGLSRCSYKSDYFSSGFADAVPVRWMPPESLLYGRYSWQSDVWAFGVTLWEIYTYALQPYYSLSNEEVVREVCQGNTLPKPSDAPDWMYQLMKLCWQIHPSERPNFPTIYSVLDAISRNDGLLPNPNLRSPLADSIAETQLHSAGNTGMNLPVWNMASISFPPNLPPPVEFSGVQPRFNMRSSLRDSLLRRNNAVVVEANLETVPMSVVNSGDSPDSLPSLSVGSAS